MKKTESIWFFVAAAFWITRSSSPMLWDSDFHFYLVANASLDYHSIYRYFCAQYFEMICWGEDKPLLMCSSSWTNFLEKLSSPTKMTNSGCTLCCGRTRSREHGLQIESGSCVQIKMRLMRASNCKCWISSLLPFSLTHTPNLELLS